VDTVTDMDVFTEITTQKKKRVVESEPLSAPFADATTKKGKNLRDLESDPLFAMSAVSPDRPLTPPPVEELPSFSPRRAVVSPVHLPLGEPPTLPNPPSLAPSSLESGPLVTFETGRHPVAAPPVAAAAAPPVAAVAAPAEGFSDVVAAMAFVAPPRATTGSVLAATVVPVVSAPSTGPSTTFALKKSGLADVFVRRSGLKYLVAAAILVVLVILLVVVGLRAESTKLPEIGKEPPKAEIAKLEEPITPPEEPKAVPTGSEERAGGGTRVATKHVGPVKTRSIGPVEKPVAVAKQPVKTERDVARPNPFGEGVKTVSQDQISAVVRSKTNQAGLKTCYERALKMDNHLTSGRMDITVSIGASGAVQRVVVNAPSTFIMVEPCIKNAVRRWTFPPSTEEYGTNFPLILQGGM
jgi:hypothetical protein